MIILEPEEAIDDRLYRKAVERNYDEFLLTLYLNGIDIGFNNNISLSKKGYIFTDNVNANVRENIMAQFRDYTGIDSRLGGLDETTLSREDISRFEEMVKREMSKNYTYDGPSGITKEMWTPDGLKYDYEHDFWDWINTINRGWQYYRSYRKFELYVLQAEQWLNDEENRWNPNASIDSKRAFLRLEKERMLTNSLYAMNKHGYLKNAQTNETDNKYEAWIAQQVMLYLLDLTISYFMGKARQIGATTTIGGACAIKTMLTKNMYTKFVAQKGKKSEELFRDKVKYVIDKSPSYITPSINGDSLRKLEFLRKMEKGKSTGANSIFEVTEPSSDCINGGSPDITLLDEIGYYDNLSEIVSEGRPTLLAYDHRLMRQVFKRQVIGWGTGGEMEKGGGSMQHEYNACKEAWAEKDYTYGILPLFLNCFARRGFTKQVYDQEKSAAYKRKPAPGEKDPKIYFHQSNPVTEDDMFLISSENIIPTQTIVANMIKCDTAQRNGSRIYRRGYFEPILGGELIGSTFNKQIVGARFIPATENMILTNNIKAAVTIVEEPSYGWVDRYYSGKDPIYTASGLSNMGGAVWDDLTKSIPAYFDGRYSDYTFCYLQCLLLNVYYSRPENGRQRGLPQLIETNVGGEYYNFCKKEGFRNTVVPHARVPKILQVGGEIWGINKRSANTKYIMQKLEEMLNLYQESIYSPLFWQQLKTFVRKDTTKQFTYEPQNRLYDKDDHLDACVYAYICRLCYPRQEPTPVEEVVSTQTKFRYVMGKNHTLELRKVAC